MSEKKYIPALRFKPLTPLFDTVVSTFMKEAQIKSRLVSQLDLKANENILDFGCGTGTLAVLIKKAKPDCVVDAVDIDRDVLEVAQRKARLENVDIRFIEYGGTAMPYADGSFDKVVTSLVLHHLSIDGKYGAFKEIYRVLKKGGEFHILDFGVQRSAYAKMLMSILKSLEPVEDNIRGKIPQYLVDSGFENVEEVSFENTLLGTVSFYRARKP